MSFDVADYSSSRAVLIGVSDFVDPAFPAVPAALNSLAGLQRVLTTPELCGWPADRVTVLRNPQHAGQIARHLHELMRDVRDVLVVYYVGHGKLTTKGQLCLVVQDTAADAPEYTGLAYDWIAQALRESPARVKITILDCCFSGQAIEALASSDDAGVADLTHVAGVYTLTATTRNKTAHVVPASQQTTELTSFTGQLLGLIEGGVANGPNELTLSDIYPHLQERLAARGLPRPNQRGTDTANRYVFTRNRATLPPADAVRPEADAAPPTDWSPAEVAPPRPLTVPSPSTREPASSTHRGFLVAAALIIALGALLTYLMTSDSGNGDATDARGRETTTTQPTTTTTATTTPTTGNMDTETPPDPAPPPADTADDALETTTLIEGQGRAAGVGDTVIVHYVGKTADGQVFDSSWDRGEPYPVTLGPNAGVIEGWNEGLVGVKVGERRRLVIGPDKAYGAQGRDPIPPNAPLAFEIDVVDIVPAT